MEDSQEVLQCQEEVVVDSVDYNYVGNDDVHLGSVDCSHCCGTISQKQASVCPSLLFNCRTHSC